MPIKEIMSFGKQGFINEVDKREEGKFKSAFPRMWFKDVMWKVGQFEVEEM
jgi:hypothetical protein